MITTDNVARIHDAVVVEQRLGSAWQQLKELGVIKNGHFKRHDYRHTRWYYQTSPLYQTGRIWSLIQDLAAIIDPVILDQTDVIVGPDYRGAMLAQGLASVVNAQTVLGNNVDCVPIEKEFQLVQPNIGRTQHYVRKYYRDQVKGKYVLLADDVIASGKTRTDCFRILEDAGAKVLGSVTVINACLHKLEGYHVSLKTIPEKDVYDVALCPMCKAGEPITEF